MSFEQFLLSYPASCPQGFTRGDLEEYFGAVPGKSHSLWRQLEYQTGSICEGRLYNHELGEYFPSECAANPHGLISYTHDVYEWFLGQPVSDW